MNPLRRFVQQSQRNRLTFDVEGACRAFKEWKGQKKTGIMTFRYNSYQSVITGTIAPVHHTPWKDALDDSLEVYLRNWEPSRLHVVTLAIDIAVFPG